jgi:hypothetical protein
MPSGAGLVIFEVLSRPAAGTYGGSNPRMDSGAKRADTSGAAIG